jgi:hypothetical protein
MKKSVIIPAGACVIILGMATMAYAVNKNFYFTLTDGGASGYSAETLKSDGETNWYVTPKATLNGFVSTWQNGETLRFRARIGLTDVAASALYSRSYPNYGTTFHYPYLSGAARAGITYHLCMDNPAGGNPSPVSICGTWCP